MFINLLDTVLLMVIQVCSKLKNVQLGERFAHFQNGVFEYDSICRCGSTFLVVVCSKKIFTQNEQKCRIH